MGNRHYRSVLITSAIVFAPLIVGCGDSETKATSQSTSAASSSSGAGGSGGASSSAESSAADSSASSSSSAGSSSSGAGGAAPSGVKLGSVSVFSGPQTAAELHSYTAKVYFKSSTDGQEPVFNATTFGPCVAQKFSNPGSLGTLTLESGGVVTITGGKVPLTLTPDATSAYPNANDSANDLFAGGETMVITAAGGVVPAFTTSVVASTGIDLSLPLQPAKNADLPVDRTSDLVFTWKNGGAGEVLVILSDGLSTKLLCTFPSADGTGAVPKAALATLAPAAKGFFALASATVRNVTAGEWTIAVLVGTSFTWNGVFNPQTFSYKATN